MSEVTVLPSSESAKKIEHMGKVIFDATSCPQDITCSADLDLLSESRRITERFIILLKKNAIFGKIAPLKTAISGKTQKKLKKFASQRQRVIRKSNFFFKKHLEVMKKYLPLHSQSETKGLSKRKRKARKKFFGNKRLVLMKERHPERNRANLRFRNLLRKTIFDLVDDRYIER